MWVIWLFVVFTTLADGSQIIAPRGGCHHPNATVSPFTLVPGPAKSVAGVDVHVGCFHRKDDRLVVVRNSKSPSNTIEEYWFLASDLCAMGHTTKDPAHLASFLLDLFDRPQRPQHHPGLLRRKIALKIVYGNRCMVKGKDSIGGNKRSGVFLGVLRGWFHAMVRKDAPLVRFIETTLHGDLITHSEVRSDADPAAPPITLAAKEMYMEDLPSSHDEFECAKTPVRIVKRSERWRWFRTSWHAELFRQSLLHHYQVTKEVGYRHQLPPRVVILRRDEDRHFDEVRVHAMLERHLTGVAIVELHTFDNIRGSKGKPPPTHARQLAILNNASILIAAHGAGLSNIAAMKAGSFVIELFPHNFRYYMYEELALLMNVKYYGLESPKVWPPRCCGGRGGDGMPAIKDNIPSLVNGVGARACKKCDIHVSDWEWQSMMRTAVAHIHALGTSQGG
ncbi:Hypothetical protein, putative [Bodo saltans]|uniref:Membrane-associated protein n=1 Tax=Bodo saltans TaxID=75058 RepID=A0A0S4JJA1_BODSA|nr:Hypothetical protein, putative [Bodo saltans]|eukprot:CUG89077.1 Hypothetical protein, putative [Bodo saltans]